jgi:hypothetical protein
VGQEIRRVPLNWQHPRQESGRFQPLHDTTFAAAVAKWKSGFARHDPAAHEGHEYWEAEADPPDREYYRPEWTTEPAGYQIYETVSEGTPKSPVFTTEEEIVTWLVSEGHTEAAATRFVKAKWCPSGVLMNGEFTAGIESLALLDKAR